MNNEEMVQLALTAFDKTSVDTYDRNYFELELRRMLMQHIGSHNKSASVEGATVRWVTRECPPTISTTNQLLHG